jgi:hypothetical protein
MQGRTLAAAAFSFFVLHAGAIAAPLAGHEFSVVHAFTGRPDGGYPEGGLLALPDGSLLGVTPVGGRHGNRQGPGTIYRITPDGAETIVCMFSHDQRGKVLPPLCRPDRSA